MRLALYNEIATTWLSTDRHILATYNPRREGVAENVSLHRIEML